MPPLPAEAAPGGRPATLWSGAESRAEPSGADTGRSGTGRSSTGRSTKRIGTGRRAVPGPGGQRTAGGERCLGGGGRRRRQRRGLAESTGSGFDLALAAAGAVELLRTEQRILTEAEDQAKITDLQDFPGGIPKQYRVLELSLGPEGALYYLNYAGWASTGSTTKIGRLEYKGTCLPATPVPTLPTAVRPRVEKAYAAPGFAGPRLRVPAGAIELRLYDPSGRLSWSARLPPDQDAVDVPAAARTGVLRAVWIRP